VYIIEIIPLASFPPQVPQLLSYFFNKKLLRGSVVEILLGNRKVVGIIVSSSDIEQEKASLKKSDFQLKKISAVISETPLISDTQLKIALWLSKNYSTPLGLCLKTALPPFFLKKNYEWTVNQSNARVQDAKLTKTQLPKPLVLLTRARDIIKNIEPEIKKVLNKKKQVLIIVPEISTAQYFYDYFAGYYEVSLMHSRASMKKHYKEWQRITSGEAEIVIGTRLALTSTFNDLGLVLLEDPFNESYKSDMTPKYWTPDLAKKIAELHSCRIIFISQTPSVESQYLIKNNIYTTLNPPTSPRPIIEIADMIHEIKSGNFSLFSRSFFEELIQAVRTNKRVLIFSPRKGYSGFFLCKNCGFSFKCDLCSVPLKLYKKPEPFLVCRRCSTVHKVPEFCPNCKSYQLKTAGFFGSQKISETVGQIFQNSEMKPDIFVFDSDSVKTQNAEKEVLKKIEESRSSVCIATQMIFGSRYSSRFDFIGITNVDALTTLPDFRSEEQLLQQFEKLVDFEPEKIIIQSYNSESQVINSLVSGNYDQFYEQELKNRELFRYPPFARLIKISFKHSSRDKAGYEARVLVEKLKMGLVYQKLEKRVKLLGPSPAFVEKERGLYIYNIIVKILPDEKIDNFLRLVPSDWSIEVDPRSIL